MLKRLLILLVVPLILSGCNKNSKEVITFSSWGSVTEVQILNNIIGEFEKDNPNIEVNFLHIPQNYFQKLHLLFASSQSPDVVFVNNLYLPLYSDKLEDLSNMVEKDIYYPESLKALSYDGHLLAVPRDVSNLVFYRNKDLIKKEPRDLDELLEDISAVKPYGISYERDVYFMLPYVVTLGEDIYHPKKSLKLYKSLEGKFAPKPSDVGSSTLAQMFLDGKIGLYLSGRWMYPKISEKANFEWDVITFPGIVSLDTSGWAISKESKHKDSAKKLVEYLSSKKSSEYFLNSGLLVPARMDTSKKIDNVIFLDAIKKSKAISIDKNFKKNIDKMNKEYFY